MARRYGPHSAIVLGTFETGLAVGRSLGRAGIRVLGVDSKKDVGFGSRYFESHLCPSPQEDLGAFLEALTSLARAEDEKPVLYITSDEFLLPVSRHRERVAESCLLLLPPGDVIDSIEDKHLQVRRAAEVGVPVPVTAVADETSDLDEILDMVPLPAFVKGRHVTPWRRLISSSTKGYLVTTPEELTQRVGAITARGVEVVVQEHIPGPDASHYKTSACISSRGETLLAFGLRKIRQNPPGAGIGCAVVSYFEPELLALGLSYLRAICYRGVGSVEFKRDARDGRLKLIELNPRYWQQVGLADRCGLNFPLAHYLDATGGDPLPRRTYPEGVKWVNLIRDLASFREYRRRGELSTLGWIRSLAGPRMDSCFAWDDPRPGARALIVEPLRWLRSRLVRA